MIMEYYKVLKCSQEPFPTSPDPGFFFKAQQHLLCLEKLCLAVINRKGCCVVLGSAGLGKTTLFFQLLERLAKDDRKPAVCFTAQQFRTTKDLLTGIVDSFGFNELKLVTDVHLLLEQVKKHFFNWCMAEKKTALFVFDEAHKLSDHCLKILEDMSGGQVPGNKLLQIIFFAEPEFEKRLKNYPGLSRSHFKYVLAPFGSMDLKRMIRFCLTRASTDSAPPTLFSDSAVRAIHRITKGNPQNILDLSHLTALTLVIQNRAQADTFFVNKCAKMIFPATVKKQERIRLAGIAGLVCLMGMALIGTQYPLSVKLPPKQPIVFQPDTLSGDRHLAVQHTLEPVQPKPKLSEKLSVQQPGADIPEAAVPEVAPAVSIHIDRPTGIKSSSGTPQKSSIAGVSNGKRVEKRVAKLIAKSKEFALKKALIPWGHQPTSPPRARTMGVKPAVMPNSLGQITVFKGETLGDMIRSIYGPYSFNPANTFRVSANNPYLKNISRIPVGCEINFPIIPVNLTSQAETVWWVQLAGTRRLQDAYRFLRIYRKLAPAMLIIPSWTSQGAMRYNIILQEFFLDKNAAERKARELPDAIFSNVRILEGLDRDKYFYRHKEDQDVSRDRESGSESVSDLVRAISAARFSNVTIKKKFPGLLGTLVLKPQDTLGQMMRDVFGSYGNNPKNMEIILDVNQQINNPNLVRAGDSVHFPSIPVKLTTKAGDVCWIRLLSVDTLPAAYDFLRQEAKELPPLLIIPSLKDSGDIEFNVILGEHFPDRNSAGLTRAKLQSILSKDVLIQSGLDKKTYFYTQ